MTEVLERSQRRWFTRAALVVTAATAVLAATATSASAVTTDGFNPDPSRLIDTRIDLPDRPAGAVQGFLQTQLPDSVPDGDSALLSITVVSPTTSGYIKAYADGTAAPATSDVNFVAGPTVAQAVLVEAGPDATGKVDLFVEGNGVGVQIVVDVIGSFPATSYTSLAPAQRVYDTRAPAIGTTAGKLGTGIYPVQLPVGLVPDDAQAVAVTLTQVGATGPGYVTALSDATPTGTSSLNYSSTSINSNLVFVKPNAAGQWFLQVQGAPTDLIVDVKGYSLSTAVLAQSSRRVFDSRQSAGGGLLGKGTVTFNVPDNAPDGADFALLNVTSTGSTQAGFLASYEATGTQLQTSNLNWVPGQDVAGFVMAPITDGKISVYVGFGLTKVVADVQGYVVNAPTDN